MKTERRHEMQTNVLADWLGHWIEQLKPYSKAILLVAVAAIVLVVGGTFLMNDQAARMSAGWSDFFAASQEANPERLRAVASDHSGTVAAVWAQMTEADLELAQGMRLLYTDRESANAALKNARDGYLGVVTSAETDQLHRAAYFGLGQAHECLGDIDEAIEAYQKVGDPGSAVFAQAQERIKMLEDSDMRQFYDWFAEQKPVPRGLSGGMPGMSMPGGLDLLSDQPDLGLSTDFLGTSPTLSTETPTEESEAGRAESAFEPSNLSPDGPESPTPTDSPSTSETP